MPPRRAGARLDPRNGQLGACSARPVPITLYRMLWAARHGL